MKGKKLIIWLLTVAMALSLCTVSVAGATTSSDSSTYSMDLSDYAGSWTKKTSNGVSYYQLTDVVYCTNPTNPELQCMNIYVPAAYMNSDGTINEEGTVGDYTATTAPILYVNGVAGYMEASAGSVDTSAISQGYIYVSVGSRGRSTTDSDGNYTGKSPWGLVDLKAGVRFLKANDDVLAGSSDLIISQGTSAGGNMSALLGSTGNSSDYTSYLEEMGAIMDATDDVFAAMCYCPISDLENADFAYEWMFQADTSYTGFISIPAGTLTSFQQALSALSYDAYISYYNSLGLVDSDGNSLTLNADGRSGSGYDYFMSVIEDAATTYLTKLANGEISSKYTVSTYVAQYSSFLSWDGEKASITSIDDLVLNYNGRMKACFAFDDMDYQQGENEELGTSSNPLVHFNTSIASMIASLADEYPTEYATYYSAYASALTDEGLAERIYLLNPLNYIGTDEVCDTASYFRIRVGTQDPHTSFTVAMNLALKLAACEDTSVDYAMVWDEEHGAADYDGELYAWIDTIVAEAASAVVPEDEAEVDDSKISLPGITKTADVATTTYGATVTYTLTSNVPTEVTEGYVLTFVDNLANGSLILDEDSVLVTIGEESVTATVTQTEDGFTVAVPLTADYAEGTEIVVTYSATATGVAGTSLVNTACVTWGDGEDDSSALASASVDITGSGIATGGEGIYLFTIVGAALLAAALLVFASRKRIF